MLLMILIPTDFQVRTVNESSSLLATSNRRNKRQALGITMEVIGVVQGKSRFFKIITLRVSLFQNTVNLRDNGRL